MLKATSVFPQVLSYPMPNITTISCAVSSSYFNVRNTAEWDRTCFWSDSDKAAEFVLIQYKDLKT